MQQPARTAAGPKRKIPRINQRYLYAPQRRISRDPRPHNPAANDEQIESFIRNPRRQFFAFHFDNNYPRPISVEPISRAPLSDWYGQSF